MTSHPSPVTSSSHIRYGSLLNTKLAIKAIKLTANLALAAAVSGGLLNSRLLSRANAQEAIQEQTFAQTNTQTNGVTPSTENSPAETPAQPGSPRTGIIEPPADPTPKPTPFIPVITGVLDLSTHEGEDIIGVGHLRPQTAPGTDNSNGDAVSWLENIILPLYISPGGEHWGWLYQGWLVPDGQTYLAIGRDAGFAMVQSEENLYSFPVLDIRDDGWFQVQYTTGGSAWAHTSQLSLGETTMVLENWEETLSEQASVYFLNDSEAQPLRSQPEAANNMLGLVSADSLIEPLDFAGDWMRVRVTRPAANCNPLTGATVTEGWMRWRSEESKSLVWYRPDGTCQAS